MSTSKYYKVEAKGQDRQEIEFFGKFVFCSNNENNFIIMDSKEIHYWVRRLELLQDENKNMLEELKTESLAGKGNSFNDTTLVAHY